ncbi:hypothetical protein KP509_14G037200 [Ceratopteris richardii]|uniref:Uncharacterized protein n=2 Tax=Ceratopteris richardii TaxID=49495 RepID=A0A8T2TDZ5_CERRI|nr:hypothetical protein KP509_14G037200 [Ceratopteris richardii]
MLMSTDALVYFVQDRGRIIANKGLHGCTISRVQYLHVHDLVVLKNMESTINTKELCPRIRRESLLLQYICYVHCAYCLSACILFVSDCIEEVFPKTSQVSS